LLCETLMPALYGLTAHGSARRDAFSVGGCPCLWHNAAPACRCRLGCRRADTPAHLAAHGTTLCHAHCTPLHHLLAAWLAFFWAPRAPALLAALPHRENNSGGHAASFLPTARWRFHLNGARATTRKLYRGTPTFWAPGLPTWRRGRFTLHHYAGMHSERGACAFYTVSPHAHTPSCPQRGPVPLPPLPPHHRYRQCCGGTLAHAARAWHYLPYRN